MADILENFKGSIQIYLAEKKKKRKKTNQSIAKERRGIKKLGTDIIKKSRAKAFSDSHARFARQDGRDPPKVAQSSKQRERAKQRGATL